MTTVWRSQRDGVFCDRSTRLFCWHFYRVFLVWTQTHARKFCFRLKGSKMSERNDNSFEAQTSGVFGVNLLWNLIITGVFSRKFCFWTKLLQLPSKIFNFLPKINIILIRKQKDYKVFFFNFPHSKSQIFSKCLQNSSIKYGIFILIVCFHR